MKLETTVNAQITPDIKNIPFHFDNDTCHWKALKKTIKRKVNLNVPSSKS